MLVSLNYNVYECICVYATAMVYMLYIPYYTYIYYYAMSYIGCGWRVAFDFVKQRRKVCAPNTAFTCNLIEIDDLLNGNSRKHALMFRCASHLGHDSHTPVLKMLRDPNTRRILTPTTSLLDPRGVFVIRSPEIDPVNGSGSGSNSSSEAGEEGKTPQTSDLPVIYVWKGNEASEETAEISKRLAGYQRGILSSAEKVILVFEGSEPDDFFKHVEKNGPFDPSRSRVWDDLFDMTKMNEPDETFQLLFSVERSMRASHTVTDINDPNRTSAHHTNSPQTPTARSRIDPNGGGSSPTTRRGSNSPTNRTGSYIKSSAGRLRTSLDDQRSANPIYRSNDPSTSRSMLRSSSSSNTRNFTLNFHNNSNNNSPLNASTSSMASSQVGSNAYPYNSDQQQQQRLRSATFTLDIPRKSTISSLLGRSSIAPVSKPSGSTPPTPQKIENNVPAIAALNQPSPLLRQHDRQSSLNSNDSNSNSNREMDQSSGDESGQLNKSTSGKVIALSPQLSSPRPSSPRMVSPRPVFTSMPPPQSVVKPSIVPMLPRTSDLMSVSSDPQLQGASDTNRLTLNLETSRSSSTMSMSGPIYALTSDRFDYETLSDFSPRVAANHRNDPTTSRSGETSNFGTSRLRVPIAPLPVPERPVQVSNSRLPDDISLIRGPTPIEDLIPVVTGELTNRDNEQHQSAAPIYSPQFTYTPRGDRTGRSLNYTMDGGFVGGSFYGHTNSTTTSHIGRSIPNNPASGSMLRISTSRDLRRSSNAGSGSATPHSPYPITGSSSSGGGIACSRIDRSHLKPKLFQAASDDGRQFYWESMGIYDDDDLATVCELLYIYTTMYIHHTYTLYFHIN